MFELRRTLLSRLACSARIAPAALAALSLLLVLAAAPAGARTPGPDPDSGEEMLGKPAPEWAFTRWLGPALDQQGLRGKVVLLRWWTVGCHFCEATLPEVEALRGRYGKDGLVTIGVFHPKPPGPVKNNEVKRAAEKRGYHGRIAIDQDWETLSRYWLAGNPERNWTSVSFLVDREGNVVWVHGGGEYHHTSDPKHARCDAQARELAGKLEELLGQSRRAERRWRRSRGGTAKTRIANPLIVTDLWSVLIGRLRPALVEARRSDRRRRGLLETRKIICRGR